MIQQGIGQVAGLAAALLLVIPAAGQGEQLQAAEQLRRRQNGRSGGGPGRIAQAAKQHQGDTTGHAHPNDSHISEPTGTASGNRAHGAAVADAIMAAPLESQR